jgi:RNA polymerase sigma-B factor
LNQKTSQPLPTKAEVSDLFRDFTQSREAALRDKLIEMHMNMPHFFTNRFGRKLEQHEDLLQVATLGLINAVDRFDPERGVEFTTFATVTILGEIKRYFRDKTWSVKVPRRIKDLNIVVNQTIEQLNKELDHSPTYEEVATKIGCSVEDILESREAVMSYHPVSLDKEIESDSGDSSSTLVEMIGGIDRSIDQLSDHLSLQSGLKQLKKEEKFVIYNRYFRNLSQAQISKMMKISQMQVSRIQATALEKLKRILDI